MILDFSQNGMTVIFEITDDNRVILKEFSKNGAEQTKEKNYKWCAIADVHRTGENPDDHHGGKHTGTSGSFSLRYVEHKYTENQDGNKLEFLLSNGVMNVTVHYQFYNGISAVRCWSVVTNCSSASIGLEYVSSFAYTGLEEENPTVYIPHNAWDREVDWRMYAPEELGLFRTPRFSHKRIMISNTGTWATKEYLPMGAYCVKDHALLWQIENNGSWQWEISDIADMMYLKLSGPTEQENQWYKELMPGESFESVKACITVGDTFTSALKEMTLYRREIIEDNDANRKLPVIFNDYMNCLMADPTTEKMIPVIDRAAEAGADYYCMDAGWYADGTWWETVGEWMPCAWRFPGGIKEVFDYIKAKGMVPGIWLEIEVMGINCPILDQFDDACFFMRHGKKVIDHGRYQLDFRNQKVRDFATGVVDRLVSEYGVGYFKIDYNIESGAGTEVDADSFGDGLLEHNRAYLSWIDEIKEKYPELILENCGSGGLRMEYALLSKHHIQSTSDQEDYRYTAYVASASGTAVLPEQGAVWAYPKKGEERDAVIFNMVNPMLQRIHLSGTIHEMDDRSFELVKEGVTCYKAIRNLIPDAIPYYPMGIPQHGDGWLCSGLKNEDSIRLAVWRMDSGEESITIPLEQGDEVRVLYPSVYSSYAEKTEGGVKVSLPNKYNAILLEIK
ncbi:MAG: alpha-galactosidase [Clostridia bacterium]|nr:alpha-galactosidase [Clostridia bacterium]